MKSILIGKTIRINNQDITITQINYDPNLRVTHISDGVNRYKLTQNDYFDFDFSQIGINIETRNLTGKRKIV